MAIVDKINSIKEHLENAYVSLESKNATLPTFLNIENLSDAILSIPEGGGEAVDEEADVLFIDYDGTPLYSYSTEEFLELTEMPPNPEHDGLVAEGWNWDLDKAKEYVSKYHDNLIGQNYHTDDGSTRIYIEITEKTCLNVFNSIGVVGTVHIDWGDGTAEDTVTGTSRNTKKNTNHTYSELGSYVIKLKPTEGTIYSLYATTSYGNLLAVGNSSSNFNYYSGITLIKKIEVGQGAYFMSSTLYYMTNLESISICNLPESMNMFPAAFFASNTWCLKAFVIPKNAIPNLSNNYTFGYSNIKYISFPNYETTMNITNYCMRYTYNLKRINLPQGVTNINPNAFNNTGLRKLVIPENVTALPSYFISDSRSLKEVDLSHIPDSRAFTIGDYVFNNDSNLRSIHIPKGTTSIGTSVFNSCGAIETITIPEGVTTIKSSLFSNCGALREIYLPSTITSVEGGVFGTCRSLTLIDLSKCTQVPTLASTNAFSNNGTIFKIVVPDSLYDTWIAAANWSSSAIKTHIIKKSEYYG